MDYAGESLDEALVDSSRSGGNKPLLQNTSKNGDFAKVFPALIFLCLGYHGMIQVHQEFLYFSKLNSLKLSRNLTEIAADQVPIAITQEASSQAAILSTGLSVLRNGPGAITSMLILSATNILGRKSGMVIVAMGGIVRCTGFLAVNIWTLPLEWLYISEFIDGLSGEALTFMGLSMAFISDTSEEIHLKFRFTLANSANLITSFFANLIAGSLASYCGFSSAFTFLLSAYGASLVYILRFIPSNIPDYKSCDQASFSVSAILSETLESFKIFTRKRQNKDQAALILLFIGITIAMSSLYCYFDLSTIYLQGHPFDLKPADIGVILSISALLSAIVSPAACEFFKKTKFSDEFAILIQSPFGALCFLIQGLATTPTQAFIGSLFPAFNMAIIPASSAKAAALVSPHERGSVQACFATINAIGSFCSRSFFSFLYGATVKIYYGTTHLIIASLSLIYCPIFFAVWWMKNHDAGRIVTKNRLN